MDYLLTWSEESVGAVKEEEEIANGRSLGARIEIGLYLGEDNKRVSVHAWS